jgi:ribosomal protein L11 methylase PrmA
VADEIQTRLTGADLNSLEFSVIPDHDWQQEWKRHAHPMSFGKRLRIWPSAPKKQETG